ncbi:quinone-dependent dihydroorotate dehydrogenase [Gammaproteobacteria bacterium]|nr:quinone-dependent dihydroorotate dehydrogenase [Gammaproteobacteria bacterium]
MKQLWSNSTLYRLIRCILFCLPVEFSHDLGLRGLKLLHRLGLISMLEEKAQECPVEVFGVSFPNPVGLAAGLDKNGDYIDALGALGFGFVEVGTVTPLPQSGNAKPRLFRLTEHEAIINRMGFNNKGVDHLVSQLKIKKFTGIVGVNIGKNFSTPVEQAIDDYLICFRKVYTYADYIVVNLSSPNTPGLRELQFGEALDGLLATLKHEQSIQQGLHNKRVPLLVKIAPDLTEAEVSQIAEAFLKHKIDGVIATNTTISRDALGTSPYVNEQGGLSGAVLGGRSLKIVEQLSKALHGQIAIIGVGGTVDGNSARDKIKAGASLVQLYTGFIYRGPALIAETKNALATIDE